MTLSHEPKQTKKCRKNLTEDMQTWIPPLWKEIDPINAENSIAKESYSFIEKMHLAIRTLLTCYVNGSHVNNLHYQDDLIPTFLHHQKVPLQYPVWSADWKEPKNLKPESTLKKSFWRTHNNRTIFKMCMYLWDRDLKNIMQIRCSYMNDFLNHRYIDGFCYHAWRSYMTYETRDRKLHYWQCIL